MIIYLNIGNDYVYGRYGNPSRNGVEAVIAAMEGAQHSLIFSSGELQFFLFQCFEEVYQNRFLLLISGMASINAVVETLKTGDQIVACSQVI